MLHGCNIALFYGFETILLLKNSIIKSSLVDVCKKHPDIACLKSENSFNYGNY